MQKKEKQRRFQMKITEINTERKYVLVSAKWSRASLMFWGRLTRDEEDRSFGGYTPDLDSCERYSLSEVKNEFKEFTNRNVFFRDEGGGSTFYATEEQLAQVFDKPIRTFLI